MTQFLQIESPSAKPPADTSLPVLRLGFRPFYLLAASFAALSVLLWAAQYAGFMERAYLAGPMAHAHEMLFGFTNAVIVGFLFTAVGNWTGRPTPTGFALAVIAALWLAGRVLVVTPYGWAAAAVNVAFPIAAAIGIGIPLWQSRNTRNYFFVGLLLVMALAVAGVHLAQLGVVALPGWVGIRIALDVVLIIMAVMGGRVIPMFTNNGMRMTKGAPPTDARRNDYVEQVAIGSLIALLVADLVQFPAAATIAILGLAAVAHAIRLALWEPWKTGRNPLVWVLHVAYAWIVVHLALRALGLAALVPPTVATHALTIGAIGGLTLGMMTRTARGHTGRPLQADRWEVTAFLLVIVAAIVRVFGPLVVPAGYLWTVELSALLWSAGFGIYAVRYWPVLTRPRLDGKPG
jgi:uncharacterized protein involved in response to NO